MRTLLSTMLAFSAGLTCKAAAAPNPWNGSWTLDAARSTVGAKEFAAPAYSFALSSDGHISWRIPAFGEVVTGKTDGQPMAINRSKPTPGLSLSVKAEGDLLLHYEVARNGKPEGAGIMRLIEGGKAWVDISWQAAKPEFAGELVYVRR